MKAFNVLDEVKRILARDLTPQERRKVSASIRAGMVNPFDLITYHKLAE